jgi:hypothetical protein
MIKNGMDKKVEFIALLLDQGQTRKEIMAKYAKRWQSSSSTFDRVLKKANLLNDKKHIIASKIADEQYISLTKDKAIEAIMCSMQRKEYLTKLIKGEIKIPTKRSYYNPVSKSFETETVSVEADANARIKAIAELNKMEGDYAPTKLANTDSKGNDIDYTPEQFEFELLRAKKILKLDE